MESASLNLTLVERALLDDPNSFEFFTAVRLLERLRPDLTTVGRFGDPAKEAVRFSVHPSLSFPASEIQDLAMADGQPAAMLVNFMGLTGPSGLLPYVYTQMVIERLGAKDRAPAAFLDLFHHRLISLFFHAWEKHRFDQRFERERSDPLTDHLRDLAGLGLESEARIGPLATPALAGYAGLLGPESRSAVALEQLVADYFDVPVRVEQFLGGWYPVHEADQCALDDETLSTRLGRDALVGDEVWDPQAKVRVRIGPLTRDRYESFLPTGEAHQPLRELLRLYGHDQFEFEIQLVLHAGEVPGVELREPQPVHERLGWSTWIRTAPFAEDADQTLLAI